VPVIVAVLNRSVRVMPHDFLMRSDNSAMHGGAIRVSDNHGSSIGGSRDTEHDSASNKHQSNTFPHDQTLSSWDESI
jgi:hypothetical protein